MNSSNFFRNDIIEHKTKVFGHMKKISDSIINRAFEHDNDKITKDVIFDIYNEHCLTQRSLEFGSKERVEFEKTVMKDAVDDHIKNNRHHFYSKRNQMNFEEVTFIDYIEVLCDWKSAMERHDLSIEEEIDRLRYLMGLYEFPKHAEVLMINTYRILRSK